VWKTRGSTGQVSLFSEPGRESSKRARTTAREPFPAPFESAGIEEFAAILRRERDRADRTHDVFTLIAIEIPPELLEERRWCRRLGQTLETRLRSTDEVGWLALGRLGIALPHTGEQGATILVRALDLALDPGPKRAAPLFTLYTYTGRSRGGGDDFRGPAARAREGRAAEPGFALALEPLLLEPPGAAKRMVDVLLGSCGLLVSLPLMALVAVAIKATSRGPVFFKQTRAGYGGRPFTLYKLRTMVDGADQMKGSLASRNELDGPVFKMSRDPRVTMVGRFLRKTSLDELPQFWNVLKGEMSLVGPRPPTLEEIESYETWQRRRLLGMGGLTGLWQVSGRSNVGFREWVRLDVRYLQTRTFWGDLLLILRTIPAVLACRGAK